MKNYRKILIGFFLVTLTIPISAIADDLIMRRVSMSFPEAMSTLQSAIAKEGFKVTRVQRVDVGLTASGYKTAEYRIVFFMNEKTVHDIVKRQPELIPFLPLKITIFAEGDETILVTLNPAKLNEFFPEIKMNKEFSEWEAAVNRILDKVQSE
ncbi:MAG TPA: DUF302 domain-containing protein [Gammaproteobacteria bacterium]|nr:DUF302 domain-containing protein [Gammaproteobacteria bacterium]